MLALTLTLDHLSVYPATGCQDEVTSPHKAGYYMEVKVSRGLILFTSMLKTERLGEIQCTCRATELPSSSTFYSWFIPLSSRFPQLCPLSIGKYSVMCNFHFCFSCFPQHWKYPLPPFPPLLFHELIEFPGSCLPPSLLSLHDCTI